MWIDSIGTLAKIPQVDQPSQANYLSTFIAALHPKAKFYLKKSKVCDLEVPKQEAVQIEDNFILSGLFQQKKSSKVSYEDLKLKDEELLFDSFDLSTNGCYNIE